MPSPLRLFLPLLPLAMLALGCNVAQLKPAPDASPPCQGAAQLENPCEPQDAGAAGCGPDLNSMSVLGNDVVFDAGGFPLGCAVYVNSPITDQNNQCSIIGACHCDRAGDGGYGWICNATH